MASTLLRAPIVYDVPGGVVHSPMVAARIAGVDTRLILDTGSTDHVLTMELVARAGLPAEPADSGTDAAGEPVRSWSIGSLPVTIAEVPMPLDGAVAFVGPEPFATWGIGGFLSPQHLHPTASVVLDFVQQELQIVDDDAAAAAAGVARRHPGLQPVWLAREPGDATILVRAAIGSHAPVVTMLDSGGKTTQFARTAVPAFEETGSEVAGRGVSGAEIRSTVAVDQELHVADVTIPVAQLHVVPAFRAVAHGLVGMDLLQGTVLMVAADQRRPVLWLVPRGLPRA